MTLEIKANSWYRTRGGEIAYVFGINPYPQEGHASVWGSVKGVFINRWFLDGSNLAGKLSESDLVEHLPDCDSFDWKPAPKIQLEAGKKYVLANGDVVGPFGFDPGCTHDYKYIWKGMQWSVYGIRYVTALRDTHNIVSEYIEPAPVYVPWDFESMPDFVRVKSKENGKRLAAWPISDTLCQRGTLWCEYKHLFDGYTQLDGKPCGRVKQ